MRILTVFLYVVLAAAPVAADPPDLESLWRHAEFREARISPTGEYLAVTVPDGSSTGVVVLDVGDFPEIEVLSNFGTARHEHARTLTWASDERVIFTTEKQEGHLARPQMTGKVFAMDADGTKPMQIYGPVEGQSAVFRMIQMLHRVPDDPVRILVSEWTNDRSRPVALLVEVDRYQEYTRVTSSPLDRGGLGVDLDGEVRFAAGVDEDWNQELAWRPDGDGDWETFENPLGADIEPLAAHSDGRRYYVSSRDVDDLGVHLVDLADEEAEAVLPEDEVEILRGIHAPDGELVGAVFNTGRPEARFLDPEHPTARAWRSLEAALPDYRFEFTGMTDDGSRGVVRLYSDREPGVLMMLETESMQLTELLPQRPWIDPDAMGSMQPFEFEARDGTRLHGLLTLPPGVEEPEEPLPMVVEVHGGPHGIHDQWGWNRVVQTWATRGYAVLQVNYRGSGGYGEQFERDAYGQWGAEMQDDVTDATRWAVDQGIAHEDRICISGGSYGGYSAMMGVIREPDLYQCAFAYVGVYDLPMMKDKGNIADSDMGRNYLDQALGNDPEVLAERSPVHHVDGITAELFIAHGSEDTQAHYDNYHRLIEALEEADIPHEKLWVEGEGHGFYEVENNVRLYSEALEMFDRTIGDGWREDSGNGTASR